MQYEKANTEYIRCCEQYKTPGCCHQATKSMIAKEGITNKTLEGYDFTDYWRYLKVRVTQYEYAEFPTCKFRLHALPVTTQGQSSNKTIDQRLVSTWPIRYELEL